MNPSFRLSFAIAFGDKTISTLSRRSCSELSGTGMRLQEPFLSVTSTPEYRRFGTVCLQQGRKGREGKEGWHMDAK